MLLTATLWTIAVHPASSNNEIGTISLHQFSFPPSGPAAALPMYLKQVARRQVRAAAERIVLHGDGMMERRPCQQRDGVDPERGKSGRVLACSDCIFPNAPTLPARDPRGTIWHNCGDNVAAEPGRRGQSRLRSKFARIIALGGRRIQKWTGGRRAVRPERRSCRGMSGLRRPGSDLLF
jgi:hypothetical protein